MKRKILAVNTISGVFFLLSSVSILGIPFLDLSDAFPIQGYFIAGLFWTGLLIGIGLQVLAARMTKKLRKKKIKTYKERKMFIPIGIFLILFVLIMIFWKKSIFLVSVDIALLLFSIEVYFYLKRRYSV